MTTFVPHIPTLRAVVDRLIPADDFPAGWAGGVESYLATHWQGDLARYVPLLTTGLVALEEDAQRQYQLSFAALSAAQQDELLRQLELVPQREGWPLNPQQWLETLTNLAAEGYYSDPHNGGNPGTRSWQMVGFDPGPAPAHAATKAPPPPAIAPTPLAAVAPAYDAIIIGSGAAGGIVACVLAEAGQRVLLVERGAWLPYDRVPLDHLRNHRLSLYGHNTGPVLTGNPRVVVTAEGEEKLIAPHEGGYHNNAMTVGGGTRVYGAQAWRFLPEDFRMASIYGTPAASSLADWPISYEELAPYYEQAEWEIGVAGPDCVATRRGARAKGYPMPPVPETLGSKILTAGAERLGWHANPAPLLINTVPYQGRPGCVQCGLCVGFACPSESKNGSYNTVIPRALATGNCTLVSDTQATRIVTDDQGAVTGVSLIQSTMAGGQVARTLHADRVIVSAGAIESARLLLNSRSQQEPDGLGNKHDQVGRNLQGHVYSGAFGLFEEEIFDNIGPGVSVSTSDFNHGNPGIIGGGMLANEFIKLPIIFWRTTLPPELPKWGMTNKAHMRHYYRRTLQVYGPIQEIPIPTARVTLHPTVTDRLGMPVARLSGSVHPESLRSADFLRDRAEEWLRASGATHIWSHPNLPRLSGGQHQAGTCRMGDDPQNSVTDRWGRVHGHENLYVIDGSLHVTNGGFNPVLTIMALAFRCAAGIVNR
jgi:choline dehydrogenase-like flavoprotein